MRLFNDKRKPDYAKLGFSIDTIKELRGYYQQALVAAKETDTAIEIHNDKGEHITTCTFTQAQLAINLCAEKIGILEKIQARKKITKQEKTSLLDVPFFQKDDTIIGYKRIKRN